MSSLKIVKLSTPWDLPYLSQSPGGKGIWGDHQFRINDECDEADYWVIWGWEKQPERVRVPKERILYLTDEAHEQRFYHPAYLAQFEKVATPRKDLYGANVVPFQEVAPWYLPLSWDELEDMTVPAKAPGSFSAMSSSLVHLEGHLRRYAFLNQMRGHFKDRMDVFGRGIRPIEDKREAFFPYQYTLALENSAIPDYFSEKIREVFLGYGFPFYWGCPNLDAYFEPESYLTLDIADFKASIERIEHALATDMHRQRFDLIVEARRRVLYEYHIFPAVVRLLATLPEGGAPAIQHITPEARYWKRDTYPARKALRAALQALRQLRK